MMFFNEVDEPFPNSREGLYAHLADPITLEHGFDREFQPDERLVEVRQTSSDNCLPHHANTG